MREEEACGLEVLCARECVCVCSVSAECDGTLVEKGTVKAAGRKFLNSMIALPPLREAPGREGAKEPG